jgi:hypothetical protein
MLRLARNAYAVDGNASMKPSPCDFTT